WAGGLLPDGAGAGLEAFGLVVLALVEQAVGEGVLAGQVRTDAEVAGRLAGVVQGDVPGLAARYLPGPAHPPFRLPVRLVHGGREDVAGRSPGLRTPRRVVG